MQKNQTKKAALYIRVSTHYQIDKDSARWSILSSRKCYKTSCVL